MRMARARLKTISPTAPSSSPLSLRTTWPLTRRAMLECRARADVTAFLAQRLSSKKTQDSGRCKREYVSVDAVWSMLVFHQDLFLWPIIASNIQLEKCSQPRHCIQQKEQISDISVKFFHLLTVTSNFFVSGTKVLCLQIKEARTIWWKQSSLRKHFGLGIPDTVIFESDAQVFKMFFFNSQKQGIPHHN